MSGLDEYLRQMVGIKSTMVTDNRPPYLGMEDYLLKHGQEFTSQPMTPEEIQKVVKANEIRESQVRQCFYNCQFLAQCCRDFVYCEGVAVSVIPTHHAWLTLNGKVVDLTWKLDTPVTDRDVLQDRNLGTFNPPYLYFGIEVPGRNWFRWWKQHKDHAVPILDDWEKGWPLFNGVPLDKIIPLWKQQVRKKR